VDETQLIARVRAGDSAAERSLYDAHVDRVYRLAFRLAGDDTLAQDFTQETFIRVSALARAGAPLQRIRFMCLVSAPEGVKAMLAAHPTVPVYTASLDRELNSKGYILPGLGDAGDRLFGTR